MARGMHRAPAKGRSKYLIVMLVVGMFVAFAVPAGAAGLASKVTGDIAWDNGTYRTAVFQAHEQVDANHPAKGHLYYTAGASTFEVDVEWVEVHDGWACFGGTVYNSTGVYADRGWEGKKDVSVVIDKAEPGVGADMYGNWLGIQDDCAGYHTRLLDLDPNVTDNTLTDGNLQIHYGKSYSVGS